MGVLRVVAQAPLLILLVTCQVDKLTNTPPPVATLSLEPGAVQDSAAAGSTRLGQDSLAVLNTGPGTLSWSARLATGDAWLAFVGPTSGTAPAKLRLAFNPQGLPTGVYRDTVVVSAENANNSPARLPVEFAVHPCRVQTITPDAPVSDSLTTGTCAAPHRAGSFGRLYSFAAQAGDSVSIVMSSATVGGYVVLDSSTAPTAPPIAQSGSCGTQPGACLRYQRLPATRTYVVEATSAGTQQTGVFALSLAKPHPPNGAAAAAQFRSDGTTGISLGASTDQSTVVLRGIVSDPDAADTLRLQVEVRPLGTTFSNLATATSDRVANGSPAFVSVTGLANNTAYHWQYRTLDQTGRASAWTPFGGNPETAADFTTSIPAPPDAPTGLGQFQSDGRTVIVVGGTAAGRSIVFKGAVTDVNPGDSLQLEVEVQPVGTAFTGVVSASSPPVAPGDIATATLGALSDNALYHWRARTFDHTTRSAWVPFGSNLESDPDFRVAVPVTQLVFTQPPTTTPAGAAITPAVQVTAQDGLGNTVTSFGGSVAVALAGNPGGDTLSGTKTITALSGVATFADLSINHAAAGYTLRATSSGLTVTSAPFAIVAGSATQIAVNAGNNQTQPAGTAVPIAPSVIVRDAQGNAVAGVAVTFAVAPGNGGITGASQITNASGIAAVGSWTLATAAGPNTLTATSTGLAGSPVSFGATGTAGDAGSIAANSPNGQSATVGTAVATAPSVIVRDQFNNPVAGIAVTFAAASGGGTVNPTAAVTTNASGIASVTSWTLGTGAGPNTVTATSSGLNGSPVIFTATGRAAAPSAGRSLVSATPPSITASPGSSVATIAVTVRDAFDNPVSGASVVLAAAPVTGNALTQPVGTTGANGEITGTLSSTAAGVKTITATVNGTLVITETATVSVTAGAVSASQSTITATSPITAGGAASIVTVTARDAQGNPIEGATVVLAATPSAGNTLTQPVGTTNASGVATGTLGSSVAGTKTVSATIGGVAVTQTASVSVTAGGVSASQSTVVAAPPSITAGTGSSTITVTARDASGNPIQGATVTLAATPTAGNTLTQPVGTTSAGGVATGTLGSTAAGPKTLSATIGGVAITQTTTVTVTAGAAATIAGNSMNPQSATAGTAVGSPPSVIVRDASGNPVAGVAVTFAVAPGNGDLTAANPTTDASGIATVGSWTLATTAGPNTLTATAAGSGISGNPVTFTATGTAGTATQLGITTPPSSSAQSGVAFIQQPVIQLQDAHGNPASQSSVVVTAVIASGPSAGAGGVTAATATTDTHGVATFSGLTLSGPVGAYTLRFEATGLTATPATGSITLGAGVAAVITANSPATQDAPVGTAVRSPPTVIVRDAAGNPVAGVSVTFSPAVGSGSVTGGTQTTNGSGIATVGSWTLSTTAGANTLTATASGTGISGNPVSFSATGTAGAPSAAQSSVSAAPPSITAGTGSSIITVTVRDANGNPVTGATVVLAATPSAGNTLTQPTGTTSASGQISGTLSSTAAGAKTVTATVNGTIAVTETATVTVTAAAVSASLSSVSASPTSITVGIGTSTITVTARDAHGNLISGATVVLAAAPTAGNTLTQPAAATNANGVATGTLSSATVGAKTVSATIATVPVTQTASVTVTAGSTTTTITGDSPDPSVVGQGVTVSFSVTSPGGTATGDVTVSDGTDSCIGTVAAGTCALTPTTAGAKTLTATYAGDANFGGSTSTGVAHTVNAAGTTTTITGHTPNPSAVGQAVSFSFTVTPNAPGSGTPAGTVTVSDGTQTCSASVAVGSCTIAFGSAGGRTVTATYAASANFAASTSAGVPHTVGAAATTTTITGDTPDPSDVGQAVTVSFTVASPGGAPTGNVTVSDGTASCVGTVTAGSCALTPTTAGAKTLIATYAGSANFAGSASTGTAHAVNAAATTTSITGQTPNPSTVGQAVSFAFAVTANPPGSGTPTGTVTVSDGTQSCNASVAVGSCSIAFSSAGARNVTAAYAGDGNFAAGTSAGVAHTVGAAGTTTTISADAPDPSVVGQAVTVTFAVTSPGGAPSGNVTVSDGAASCVGSVAAGSCGLTPTTAGAKTLVATYAGNVNFAGSSSAGAAHTVSAAATTTTITAHTPDPSATGQAVSFTFSVAATAPGSGTPAGTVSVTDGVQSCSATVAVGSCTIAFTTAGDRTVTASYAGTADFASSTSASVTQTVGAAATTTAITGHTPSPSAVGQAVAVTYTVTSAGGTPAGNVTVSDGTVNCVGTVAAGSCTLTPTTAGAKTLVATYGGNSNFAGSASTGTAHTVNAAATTTTITGDTPDPSVVGQAVAVTFTVTSTGGTPTGTVTVSDGTQSCGGSVAAGGCSIAFSSAGGRTVVASYAGDANFAASTSAGVTHTVGAASTSTAITGHTPSPSAVGQAVTVTYTVTSAGGTPAGNVTVSDGTDTCVGTVAAGTCTLTPTTAGAKSLTATYAGSANFAASTSVGVAHAVGAASTTTVITGHTPNPSAVGQGIAVTFTVTSDGGTPTGNVTVTDGAASCVGGVGAGTCTLTPTTSGAKTLTATYAGNPNFAGSTSAGVAHAVGVAGTTTTITAHTPDPSAVGQAVTVTFTVTSIGGTPAGNVTVSDGTVNCVATVADASCVLTPTTAGAKTLTATYAGNANFAGSTSAGVAHAVGVAGSTTTITGHTPSPSVVGQAVTVTFTVTSTGGTPAGNVTVSDGAVSCIGTVAAGTCTLTPTTAGAKIDLASFNLTTAFFNINKINAETNPATHVFIQDGRQVHQGIEVIGKGKITDQLTFVGGFTIMDAKIEQATALPASSGKIPINVPEQQARAYFEYAVPPSFVSGLTFVAGANYYGRRPVDALNTGFMPSATIFDAGLRYEPIVYGRKLTFNLTVSNIFNTAYWASYNASGMLLGAPRIIALSGKIPLW